MQVAKFATRLCIDGNPRHPYRQPPFSSFQDMKPAEKIDGGTKEPVNSRFSESPALDTTPVGQGVTPQQSIDSPPLMAGKLHPLHQSPSIKYQPDAFSGLLCVVSENFPGRQVLLHILQGSGFVANPTVEPIIPQEVNSSLKSVCLGFAMRGGQGRLCVTIKPAPFHTECGQRYFQASDCFTLEPPLVRQSRREDGDPPGSHH